MLTQLQISIVYFLFVVWGKCFVQKWLELDALNCFQHFFKTGVHSFPHIITFSQGFIIAKIHNSKSWRKGTTGYLLLWSPKFKTNIFLFVNNFGDFSLILISWFIKLSVRTFQPLIVIYIRDYYYQRCTSNYRPLSYPLDP